MATMKRDPLCCWRGRGLWYRGLLAPATVRCHRVATQTGWRRTDKMYMFTLLGYVNFIDEIKKRERKEKGKDFV